ncbi:MAG: hypothetical protein RLY57_687 [Candidatus Parcubacteria bacterium]|jgi:uncharacterized protein HemX
MEPTTNNVAEAKSGIGAIIAVVIIIAVIAFGGYYFWKQMQDKRAMNTDRQITPELQSTTTQGINAELEADLKVMQQDDLGESDMQSIDSEFKQ